MTGESNDAKPSTEHLPTC